MEDWLCEHVQDFFGEDYGLLGRQVTLPDGKIMDMLLWNRQYASLAVVELKAVVADGEALAQLLCYMHLLKRTIDRDEFSGPIWAAMPDEAPRLWRAHMEPEGFLVAPDFSEYVKVGNPERYGVQLRFAKMYWQPHFLREGWVADKVGGECPEALATALELHIAGIAAKYEQEAEEYAECAVGEDHDGDLDEPEYSGLEG